MRFFPDRIGNLSDFVAHFAKVHSINDFPWNVVALRTIDDLLKRRGSFYRRAHGKKVVFTNENNRQPIQRCEVQSFVERALIDSSIPKEAERDVILATVFDGTGQSHRQWHVGADDGMSSIHVMSLIEKMH